MKNKKIRLQFQDVKRIDKILIIITLLVTFISSVNAQQTVKYIKEVNIERKLSGIKSPGSPDSASQKTVQYKAGETKIIDGDVIAIDIPGSGNFIRENKKQLKNIVLKMDNIDLAEFPAYISNADSNIIRFRFQVKNMAHENRILMCKLPGKASKNVLLGIKFDETNILYFNDPVELYFKKIDRWGNTGVVIIILLFLVYFTFILLHKSVIKEDISNLNADDQTQRACFSFSKSQFAFWTFIIIASFIYIWTFTGDLQSINTTALILLGITSATIVTGNLINKNQEDNAGEDKTKLMKFRSNETGEKSNYLLDILSDRTGISIHRLQSLIFNLVFGIAFFSAVITNYTMPDFTDTQLILLGLSNGTYAFLKINENK